MLFLPPGSAKSTYASVLFPPWWLAQGRGRSVIAASNAAQLAENFSRKVRGHVRQHSLTLGYGLEREAEELWTTSAEGQYLAAGAGGTITGFRADLALIDDPIRGREEADSEIRRQRVWDWYQDDLQTRLRPGAAIVLIQTRWHEDDLAGRLLQHEPDAWRVLSVPMVSAGEGDPLGRPAGAYLWADDAYNYAADIQARRHNILPRTWSALYQQQPAPAEGTLFKAAWLREIELLPARDTLHVYGASDYAVTADGGDFTVHVVVGIDREQRWYVLDLWRGQASSDQTVDAFCDMVARWKPLRWAEESGQIKSALGPWIERRMRERRAFVAREPFAARSDKAVRAQPAIAQIATNGLYVQGGVPWWPDMRSEMLGFPAGKHDDQVDALGLVGQLLDKMTVKAPPRPAAPPRDRWDRRRPNDAEGSWKVA